MGYLQITYNDLENLIETASVDKPYLVYSYKLRKMPNPSGYNKLNDKSVIVCWVGKEELESKESVALVILPEKESLEVQKNCIHVKKNGGKIKYAKFLHDYFTEKLFDINTKIENSEKRELNKAKTTNWFPVVKLSYPVKVVALSPGTDFICPIMGTEYKTTRELNYVVTGVYGEMSPVNAYTLKRDYVTLDGDPIDDDFLNHIHYDDTVDLISLQSNKRYFAKQLHPDDRVSSFTSEPRLIVANRGGFKHGSGDYIVTTESDLNNVGEEYIIVNGLVFEKTYKLLKEGMVDPKIEDALTKKFLTKKDYYINLQKKLLAHAINFNLKRYSYRYSGMADDVLKCKSDIVGKNVFQNHLTNLELVSTGTHDYLVPKGFGFLVRGTVSEHYYYNFIKDEQALDKALKTSLACSEKYAEFASYVDELQDEVDYQNVIKEYEKEKLENSKTLLGNIQNVFIKKPNKKK